MVGSRRLADVDRILEARPRVVEVRVPVVHVVLSEGRSRDIAEARSKIAIEQRRHESSQNLRRKLRN